MRTGKTRGLARKTADQPRIVYDPADWAEFGNWPELVYPTAWAKSTGCFTVINAWDRAAMTFGFIQLAAHTGDDFLPFFRRLFADLHSEAKLWFPELDVVGGKLCFIKGTAYRSLEVKVRRRTAATAPTTTMATSCGSSTRIVITRTSSPTRKSFMRRRAG